MQPTLWGAVAPRRYDPTAESDRAELFQMWLDLNPEAVEEMEGWAVALDGRGMPVSVQYLFEKERYEGTATLHPVPFTTVSGKDAAYSINHNDRALFGRRLQRKFPDMDVRTRKSKFDREV